MQENKQSILESPLFGNKYIKHCYSPIFISSFCKSDIKYVKDIWDTETSSFLSPESIRDRLIDRTGFIAKYNKIKTSFSPEVIEILKGQNGQIKRKGVTINNDLNIHIESKILEPRKLIQNILLDRNFEKKFQLNSVFNENLPWKQIWQSLLEITVSNKEKQSQWKSNSQCNFHRA